MALIDKVRPGPNVAVARSLHGDVRGKRVLIIDDMIDTGGTLAEAVNLVLENGAASVRLAATHGIFSGRAKECLRSDEGENIFFRFNAVQNKDPQAIREGQDVRFDIAKNIRSLSQTAACVTSTDFQS